MVHDSPALDSSLAVLRNHNSGHGGVRKRSDLNSLRQREEFDRRGGKMGEEGFDWTRFSVRKERSRSAIGPAKRERTERGLTESSMRNQPNRSSFSSSSKRDDHVGPEVQSSSGHG